MAITDWPAGERPREKLIARGVESLSDSELLAVFLRNGLPGRTALDLARDLLWEFGGLIPLIEADRARFCAARGLGTAKYAALHASLELGRRYLECRLARGPELSSPRDTRNYLIARLRGHKQEVFACLFLDSRHRLIGFEELFHGTINSASVYPREVVIRALALQAAAVILAHNHPSGDAEPSEADRALTRKLEQALGLIDVRVLDHFVIGESQALSFAERGLI